MRRVLRRYEPSRQEIADYATWCALPLGPRPRHSGGICLTPRFLSRRLGMDATAPRHQPLLYIAREALKAALPPDWKLCQTPEKDPFYFNFATGDSSWEHPCDTIFKQMFQEEQRKLDASGTGPAGGPSGAGTPRCDAVDALAGAEQLEGCAPSRPAPHARYLRGTDPRENVAERCVF